MNNHGYAVILAGGSGERFWPMSTQARPKQFVSLFGDKPLIRHAADRLEGLFPPERIFVITAESLVNATKEAMPMLPASNIVGEPCRRDTLAASVLALALVKDKDPDGVVVILTADQLMENVAVFQETLKDSIEIAASQESIVTIGITPTTPSTGFGYIEAGDDLVSDGKTKFRKALRFVEKPNAETAKQYIESKRFFWNAGMFIWSVRTMEKAVKEYAPEMVKLIDLPKQIADSDKLPCALAEVYPTLKKVSVDYAIMEKFPSIVVAAGTFGWDDVGTWTSVSNHFKQDDNGNTPIGTVAIMESDGNIAISSDGTLLALVGVKDLVVVKTEKSTLVCHKDKVQDLKKLLQGIDKEFI